MCGQAVVALPLNSRHTSKAVSRILLNEIATFDRLLQHLFNNILKNRVLLQFGRGSYERVGVLHHRDKTQDLLVSTVLRLNHLLQLDA